MIPSLEPISETLEKVLKDFAEANGESPYGYILILTQQQGDNTASNLATNIQRETAQHILMRLAQAAYRDVPETTN